MTRALRLEAFGKINLCLFVGEQRAQDGKHDLTSVVVPLELSDTLTLAAAPPGAVADSVACDSVKGENLALGAIAAWREESGWDGPPVELSITKRIPIAAGMGGGSADAAGALRLVAAFAGRPEDPLLAELAPRLGADVPALLHGGPLLAEGAGERLCVLPPLGPMGIIVVPSRAGLSTPEVFAKAAAMGLRRANAEIQGIAGRVRDIAKAPDWSLPDDLLGNNDLQAAAIELEPSIGPALADVRETGADASFVTGSGPTVVGVFAGSDGMSRAAQAARTVAAKHAGATACALSPRSATIEEVA